MFYRPTSAKKRNLLAPPTLSQDASVFFVAFDLKASHSRFVEVVEDLLKLIQFVAHLNQMNISAAFGSVSSHQPAPGIQPPGVPVQHEMNGFILKFGLPSKSDLFFESQFCWQSNQSSLALVRLVQDDQKLRVIKKSPKQGELSLRKEGGIRSHAGNDLILHSFSTSGNV